MSLIVAQRTFLTEIAADDTLPPSSTGMAIYRNAYRARLGEALAASFARTRRWVGEDMFEMAAAHYILARPPSDWTLDSFGHSFPETLEGLFAEDLEVAELAWLEWHMQKAFAAADQSESGIAEFVAKGGGEAAARLCFEMAAGFATRTVRHDLAALWHALQSNHAEASEPPAHQQGQLIVWRKALQPHFRLLGHDEWAALKPLVEGKRLDASAATLGDADQGAVILGQWLAGWIAEGLFARFRAGD